MLENLRAQREQYEADRERLMSEVISPSKQGRNIAVTLTDNSSGEARQFQLDRDAVLSGALEHPEVAQHQQTMGNEVDVMRARLKAEREALKKELEAKKQALAAARSKTGWDVQEEARRREADEARAREEADFAMRKQQLRAAADESERVMASMTEAEKERQARMESEKRALDAEMAAERAKFDLEKQRMLNELEKARAEAAGMQTPMQSAQFSPGGMATGADQGAEAIEGMLSALQAERKAQEAAMEAERQRLDSMMERERGELAARLDQEKAALQSKLDAKKAQKTAAMGDRTAMESEIAQTLRLFQEQLQRQQEQLQQMGQQGQQHQQQQAPAAGPDQMAMQAMTAQQAISAQQYAAMATMQAQATAAAQQQQAATSAMSLAPVNPFAPPDSIPASEAPTDEEIADYAIYLGMDPVADRELLYIAEWALTAPLPDGWTEHNDASGNEFYYNQMTGVSTYEHPLDEHYRSYYRQIKQQGG